MTPQQMSKRTTVLELPAVKPETIARMERWGEWCARRGDHGLGLPHASPFTRLAGVSGGSSNMPGDVIEYVDTERAVLQLDPLYRQAVREEFVRGGTKRQKARACQCREEAFEYRLFAGMRGVEAWLDAHEYPEMVSRKRVLHEARTKAP